jgi:hypothetical protein
MSQFLPLIRGRLHEVAEQAAAAADALGDADVLDLTPHQVADVLQDLDGVAARVGGIVERLSGAMDPARLFR